jgi:lipopolysaccharide export system protein LptA
MRSLVWLALCLAAAPALAQQAPATSTCNVQIDSSRHSNFRLVGAVYETFANGGVWAHCREQPTTMYSDSVAWYPERDLLYLVGHVRFQDSVSVLNADRVTYYLQQERLFAEGSVYTKNFRTRSDLRGPNLDYYRVAPAIRDTLEIFARARPTIHFFSAPRGDRSDSAEPFVVVADRTHMRGNDRMWAGGTVTIDRSDLAASGDSGQLDLGRNVGALLGHPQVNGKGADAYHLRGDRITFTLTTTHEIRRVLSAGQAAARGSDWHLDADTLDMTLDSGKVQLAEAWGRHQRPDAVSGTQTIIADSLDIHMPAQLVRLVWAYGHARTVTRDTTVRDTTAGRDSGLVRANEDWITGDTLRADFAVKPDSAGRKPKSELEHMTSFGSARALYHVEAADTALRGRKGVNYSRGRRIDIATADSKVRTVDVVGQVQGIYLEPLPPGADTLGRDSALILPADSTHAPAFDSTRARAADTTGHPSPAPARPAPADTVAHPVRAPARPPAAARAREERP